MTNHWVDMLNMIKFKMIIIVVLLFQLIGCGPTGRDGYDFETVTLHSGEFPLSLSYRGASFENYPVLTEAGTNELHDYPELAFLSDAFGYIQRGELDNYLAAWRLEDQQELKEFFSEDPERFKNAMDKHKRQVFHVAHLIQFDDVFKVVVMIDRGNGTSWQAVYTIMREGMEKGYKLSNQKSSDDILKVVGFLGLFTLSEFENR